MNLRDAKYQHHFLIREMLETADIVARFRPDTAAAWAAQMDNPPRLFITGEGSSRIFPARRAVNESLRHGCAFSIATEGATQSEDYDLSSHAVIGVSNSGRTRETLRLMKRLIGLDHPQLYGITAHNNSPLSELSINTHVLDCGPEKAVAATKSVIAQAIFLHAVAAAVRGSQMPPTYELSLALREVLMQEIPTEYIKALANSSAIYFCGRNDGVSEELALKANEIVRRKAFYLEGTLALHGLEEVMEKGEAIVLIKPYREEEERFAERLESGLGMPIIAISDRNTSFPTIRIPSLPGCDEYLQLAAGWSLLVEIGLHLGIDVDRPLRARKVGNE